MYIVVFNSVSCGVTDICVQVSDWFEKVGDVYLNKKDLGSSLAMANALRDEHVHFERQARVYTVHLLLNDIIIITSGNTRP